MLVAWILEWLNYSAWWVKSCQLGVLHSLPNQLMWWSRTNFIKLRLIKKQLELGLNTRKKMRKFRLNFCPLTHSPSFTNCCKYYVWDETFKKVTSPGKDQDAGIISRNAWQDMALWWYDGVADWKPVLWWLLSPRPCRRRRRSPFPSDWPIGHLLFITIHTHTRHSLPHSFIHDILIFIPHLNPVMKRCPLFPQLLLLLGNDWFWQHVLFPQ